MFRIFFNFVSRLCNRWIPRGYYRDELTEGCKAYYAPQKMDTCDCDDKLACFVDHSEGGIELFEINLFFVII